MPQKTDIPRVKLDDAVRRVPTADKTKIVKFTSARTNTLQASPEKDSSSPYEEWSRQDLDDRTAEVGIEGGARKSRKDRINTLRNY